MIPARAVFALLAGVCALGCSSEPRFDPSLVELVPAELWSASNRGRAPFDADGFFAFPDEVRRVWVDVGAHELTATSKGLAKYPDLAIVAIEPRREPWATWPDDRRVIGVPVAISLERGLLDFNVNRTPDTSSLLKTAEGHFLSEAGMKTLEVRKVPSVRLQGVLERIPDRLVIEYLKTDIQGLDLQALKSAGEQLRRVGRINCEVIHVPYYEKAGTESMSVAGDFHAYMSSMGFRLEREAATPHREALGAHYVNEHWQGEVIDFPR